MPHDVYLITGQMGSGKDTAVSFLEQDIAEYDPPTGSVRINFADAIRELATLLFGLTEEQMQDRVLKETPLDRWPFQSPREILRNLGMTLRDLYPGLWIKVWQAKVDAVEGETIVLCSDLRFPDEEEHVKTKGYRIIKIIRPGFDGDPHPSETHILYIDADYTIINDGSLEDFQQKVTSL